MKYQEEISYASQTYGVDEVVIYAVINTESRFNKDAISSKGAVGLMQVLPSTAEELAVACGLDEFDLQNPSDNIIIGTYYISKLYERFEDLETALCAYNAGPTNVKNWLENEEYSDDGVTLKYIPFEETRGYIQKIQKNLKYYTKKL